MKKALRVCVSVQETQSRALQQAAALRAARGPQPTPLPGLNMSRAAAGNGLVLITEQSPKPASFGPFGIREQKRTRGLTPGGACVFSCLAELSGPARKVSWKISRKGVDHGDPPPLRRREHVKQNPGPELQKKKKKNPYCCREQNPLTESEGSGKSTAEPTAEPTVWWQRDFRG